jgi:hypothetical protein
MTMVIILEIIIGIVVLAAVVRFAIRDTRRRSGASGEQEPAPTQPQPTTKEAAAAGTPAAAGRQQTEQPLSEATDRS